MKSSGMRRGLAVLAVSAMAAVGLPLAASANTIEDQMDSAHGDKTVTLFAVDQSQMSTKNDGQNSTINLAAGATSDIDSVRFQFSTDGGTTWTNIIPVSGPVVLTSPNDDGIYSIEWNPAANGLALPAAGVEVRANGHSNLDGLDHPGTAFNIDSINSTFDTVSITEGSALGVWKAADGQHKVIVQGKTSNPAGQAWLGAENPDGLFAGAGVLAPSVAGNWKTIYNIQPFYPNPPFGYNAPDEIAFTAYSSQVHPTTADTEGFTLYDQVLTELEITANPMNPGDPNAPVPVTIKALDQFGNPIAGVNVSSTVDDVAFDVEGQTNVDGIVDANIATPAVDYPTQAVNDGTVEYIGNAAAGSQVLFNEALGDIHENFTLGQAYADDLVASTVDGTAFDFDEQDSDDIQVQVTDQSGGNFDVTSATQDLTYHWQMTPFDGEPETGDSHTVTTEVGGKFDIPVLDPADFPDGLEDGTYELFVSLSDGGTGHAVAQKSVLTVKAGEAAVVYTDPDGDGKVISPVGSTANVQGKLQLADGTGLPGRRVDVNFVLGDEYDEDGNTGVPDAVIVSNDPATTGANGAFTVEVEDLSNDPTEVEIDGFVEARSANTPGIGDWLGDGPDPEPYTHGVDFVTDQVPAGSVLEIEIDEEAGPAGGAAEGQLVLEDSFGDRLRGVQVELSLDTDGSDGAFFINLNSGLQSAFAEVTEGDYVHTLNEELGDTITVSTNFDGEAFFATSIGRDTGFDADGEVVATVSGEVDGVDASDDTEWSSDNPFNVSEISIVRTPGEPDNARIDRPVLFDVFAKDQYGNPSRGVEVDVKCEVADDEDCPTVQDPTTHDGYPSGSFPTSDLDDGGDFELEGNVVGDFDLTAFVVGGLSPDFFNVLGFVNTSEETTEKFANDVSNVFNVTAADIEEVEVSADFSQSFYAANINEDVASYTLTTSPANPVEAGQPVTATLTALDAEGNPLEGLRVDFVRTGDPDTETLVFTDEDGVAEYVFEVEQECFSDTVTAVVRDTVTYDGDPASGGKVSDLSTVVQSTDDDGQGCDKPRPNVSLQGRNSENNRRDILNVSATSTADLTGAPVMLQKKVAGEWKRIGAKGKTLNANGEARYSVKDRNGNKVTKYRVKVKATDDSLAAWSDVLNRR